MNIRLVTIDEMIEIIKQGKASDVYVVEKIDITSRCCDASLSILDDQTIFMVSELFEKKGEQK